ncbi:MAG: AMP-binding protein, partial [Mycobacterium sp.]
MADPAWAVHLEPGNGPATVDDAREGSLPEAGESTWAAAPTAPAVGDGRHAGGAWLSADELEATSRTVAARLLGAGLSPGDRVLFSCSSSVELVVAHVAALRARLVVVPANPAYRAREMAHILADARP